MTVEQAIQHAREWQQGLTVYQGAQGWRIVCMVLADAVERLTSANIIAEGLAKQNKEMAERFIALKQERDELRRRVAELERSLKSVAEWLDGDTNSIARDVGIGVCSFNDIYRSTEHCIEKIINPALLNQIEGGQ